MYEFELWKLWVAGMIRVFGPESDEVSNYLRAQTTAGDSTGQIAMSERKADKHGTFHIAALDVAAHEVAAAGLPGPINKGAKYRLLVTFNTFTKRFGVHRYLHEPGFFPDWILDYEPWNLKHFIPRMGHDNVLGIGVLDEDNPESLRPARRERRYSLPNSVHETVGRLQRPESPDEVPESPDPSQEALVEEPEMLDLTQGFWIWHWNPRCWK